jgi:hypothetical protein
MMTAVGSVSGAQADAIDFGAAWDGAIPYSAIDGSGFSGTLSTPCPAVTARVRRALNPIRQRRLGYRTVAQAPERTCSENSLGIDFGRVGSLGGASASSSATFSGMGNVPASANASGGPAGAIVNDEVGAANGGGAGPSGAAAAQSAAQNASGSGTTTERSPAAQSLTGGAAGGVWPQLAPRPRRRRPSRPRRRSRDSHRRRSRCPLRLSPSRPVRPSPTRR